MPHSNPSAVSSNEELFLHWWGRRGYKESTLAQEELRDDLLGTGGLGHLVFVEHPHVITSGRNHTVSDAEIQGWKRQGVDYSSSSRGGKLTYHGPGQLVVYPIVNLAVLGLGVRDFVESLNSGIALWLREYGIETEWKEDAPGLWTRAEPSRKLVSVGLRVTRGVTTHGAALNLSTETDYFQVFQPCGFAGSVMSTLKNLTPTAPSVAEAAFQLGPRLIEKWGKRARPGENWPPEHEGTAREAEGSERDTRN